jgi:hypothetical protein
MEPPSSVLPHFLPRPRPGGEEAPFPGVLGNMGGLAVVLLGTIVTFSEAVAIPAETISISRERAAIPREKSSISRGIMFISPGRKAVPAK